MALVATASAQVQYETIIGTLSDDGTPWAVVTPKPLTSWNGTIILDLDGNSVRTSLSSAQNWLLVNGYAYGGTNRSPVNYNFVKAVDHLVTVRQEFINYYGQTPVRTIAWGLSRGGFVGRLCMEFRPEIFDGAIIMAGGGGGEIAVLNSKLDSLFVLKTLVDPTSPLQIVGVPNIPAATTAETTALTNLVNLANSTAEGRARLALAAAIEQFAPWTVSGTTEPAPDDYDAQYAQLVLSLPFVGINYVFANPIVVRAPIEELAGGVVSWNHGVNYSVMLIRSGRYNFVKAMYKKAGLSLMADLLTLRDAPRIMADPTAVAKAEKIMSYTGEIYGPIINLDNIGDPVDPPSMKIAYNDTVRAAGNNKLLRIVWVRRAGHGGQSDLEKVAAFVTLINRLDTGKWGDTSAGGMTALAQQIASETNPFSSVDTLFIKYHAPKLLRPWDVSDWDSYKQP
jgi:pimeloyl-ACP methyl ester carboxylesterase